MSSSYAVTAESNDERILKIGQCLSKLWAMVKVVMWSRGAHLTKPGWSKPHTHSTPN